MSKTYRLSDHEAELLWPWLDGRDEIKFSKDFDLSLEQQDALYNILDAYREDMSEETAYLFERLSEM